MFEELDNINSFNSMIIEQVSLPFLNLASRKTSPSNSEIARLGSASKPFLPSEGYERTTNVIVMNAMDSDVNCPTTYKS